MDLIELGSALAAYFDRERPSPSHDQISSLIGRYRLREGDPSLRFTNPVGKMRRVREVLIYASDTSPEAGLSLARELVSLLRAAGAFHATENKALLPPLQRAFEALGWTLSSDGSLRETVLDTLSGPQLTAALRAYQRRANVAPDDPALQVGTAKDLVEATARHVLEERVGGYSPGSNFPTTLAHAYQVLGLEIAPQTALDPDPRRAMQQCLFQLALTINKLRNQTGTGHGRPQPVTLSAEDARLAARANALVSELLLNELGP